MLIHRVRERRLVQGSNLEKSNVERNLTGEIVVRQIPDIHMETVVN